MHPVLSTRSITNIRSNASHAVANHLDAVLSNTGTVRDVDPQQAAGDMDLLEQIGYKQEFNRNKNVFDIFSTSFSIIGILPTMVITVSFGIEGGPAAMVWGWLIASVFIFCVSCSLSFIGSAFPSAGGVFFSVNNHCSERYRVIVSFMVGCANIISWSAGNCALTYGCVQELFAAIQMGTGYMTNRFQMYGIFIGLVISMMVVAYSTTRWNTVVQKVSLFMNIFIALFFIIAVPIGYVRNVGPLNSASYVFGTIDNQRTWSSGWSFVLSWLPAIFVMCTMDSCIHMSEECKNPTRNVPIGILGTTASVGIVGWIILIVLSLCIKDQDIGALLDSDTGMVFAQVMKDALGERWSIAGMILIFFTQYLMSASSLVSMSRQVFAFARDDGIPVIYKQLAKLEPKTKVPINATTFACVVVSLFALLTLVDDAASGSLFTLGVVGNLLAWGTAALLMILPTEAAKRFRPGPFYSKWLFFPINLITVLWLTFAITLSMFPDNDNPDKQTMNYAVVVMMGCLIIFFIYYVVYGHKHYHGPKSNLELSILDAAPEEVEEYSKNSLTLEKCTELHP